LGDADNELNQPSLKARNELVAVSDPHLPLWRSGDRFAALAADNFLQAFAGSQAEQAIEQSEAAHCSAICTAPRRNA
jgi:hypothetical protein